MRRFRALARGLSLLLLLIAGLRLATAALPLVDPALSTVVGPDCQSCFGTPDPAALIEREAARQRVREDPAALAALQAHLAAPRTRLMLFAAEMIRALPFFAMFCAMALALRALAAHGFSATAIAWLRRAALAALVWPVGHSGAVSLRWTALSPIADGEPVNHLVVKVGALVVGILVSGAAWVIVWALEEARAMQQDLEEYV